MLAIIALALTVAFAFVVVVALAILGIAVHLLFTPWLLVVAIAILAWVALRPRHSRQ